MGSLGHFHPEFGYVAPTSRFWYLVRTVAIAGTLGLLAGVIGVIALSQRPEVDRIRDVIAAAVRNSEPVAIAAPSILVPHGPSTMDCSAKNSSGVADDCPGGTGRPGAPKQAALSLNVPPAVVPQGVADAQSATDNAVRSSASPAKPQQKKTVVRRPREPVRQDPDPATAFARRQGSVQGNIQGGFLQGNGAEWRPGNDPLVPGDASRLRDRRAPVPSREFFW